ncbi:MAG TPA: hypothetical protein VN325_23170 [Steroidobacteraceae bacterium]|nr:hypothetical protein [Steroidobacteraceae bacterium]
MSKRSTIEIDGKADAEMAAHIRNLIESMEITATLQETVKGGTIYLDCNMTDGWRARFENVAGMPNATLPLPFTWRTLHTVVYADMVHRFPTACVI